MSDPTERDLKQWAAAVRWLVHVDDDLRAADIILADVSPSIFAAALHCHQAAEKMAKAALIGWNVAPPRIHDVTKLGKLVAAHDADVGRAIEELGGLTAWYLSTRYPDALENAPSVEEIRAALAKLQSLRKRIAALAPKA